MIAVGLRSRSLASRFHIGWVLVGLLILALWPRAAAAIPLFNRQTGQNCVACHAGGQFPELTPYGRMFKMTGYTIGERTVPVSAMALVSYSKVADTSKSDNPSADFSKNGNLIFATGSLFLGGKITDNIGAFAQITFDPYAVLNDDGSYSGHTNADNFDLRWADRWVDGQRDLIFGVSANNNPSVSDPWNTAAAWMQYVPVPSPSSSQFIDGNAPYPGFGAGGNIAGVSAYAFWNRQFYAELGAYRSANGIFSILSAGLADAATTKLRGLNPYWRLAYNHEWGAHSLMVGTSGMVAQVYDDPLDTSDPSTTHHFRDLSIDAQYQYLLDPHTVTGQVVFGHSVQRYPDILANQPVAGVDQNGNPLPNTNAEDTTNLFRAKITYTYQARYGGSVGLFNLTGSTNSASVDLTRVVGNASGDPATRGMTYELFWTPVQYLRIGAQYTTYSRFHGASSNYDGSGRNASDNNTLFLYAWAAY
jgi:hypothetical protein